jgi:plastocyanin domain-containing protein
MMHVNLVAMGRVATGAALIVITLVACESVPSGSNTSQSATSGTEAASTAKRIAITAESGRFEPAEVHLIQGTPAVLEFTRVVDSTCMRALRMPWMEEAVDLPMNEKVEVAVDTSMSGAFTYSCWMNMIFGEVVIHEAQ